MILGLSSYAGAGKDTAAGYLTTKYGFVRVAFADKLREFALNINPNIYKNGDFYQLRDLVEEHGWEFAKRNYMDVREFLQSLGHGARETFGDRFWIEQALTEEVLANENIVITDLRYMNEVEEVSRLGGYIIRVERQGIGPVNDHITEKPLPFDYVVHNPNDYQQGFYTNLDLLVRNITTLMS